MVFRKSWTQFLRTVFRVLFWIVLLAVVFAYQDRWAT